MVMLQRGTMPRAKRNDADDDGPEVMIDNIRQAGLGYFDKEDIKNLFLNNDQYKALCCMGAIKPEYCPVNICENTSRFVAPIDFRMPISLTRSEMLDSMILIMPIPPTSRQMPAMNMPLVLSL